MPVIRAYPPFPHASIVVAHSIEKGYFSTPFGHHLQPEMRANQDVLCGFCFVGFGLCLGSDSDQEEGVRYGVCEGFVSCVEGV